MLDDVNLNFKIKIPASAEMKMTSMFRSLVSSLVIAILL